MTLSETKENESPIPSQIPRRDWVLLPLLGVLTILFLAGAIELTAMQIFPQLGTGPAGEDCMVFNDPQTGVRGIPNCRVWEKIPESELFEYRFNSSGFRANEDFRPKPPGTFRIVMIGTSFTMGMRVPNEKTLAALLPLGLSRRTGLKVELYNEAMPQTTADSVASHFDKVRMVEPDLLLWVLSPGDVSATREVHLTPIPDSGSSYLVRAWHHLVAAYSVGSSMDVVRYAFRHTRTSTLISNLLYSDQSQYVRASLQLSDYLAEPGAARKEQLKRFDAGAARLEAQAMNAGVPLVAVLLPDHAEAAMISMQEWPTGVDPYRLDRDLRSIVTSHGGTYIDIFPDIRNEPNLPLGYFSVDGHPNALGHAILSELLSQELTSGAIPALRANAQPHRGFEQGK
jgi:hypothetical protein